MSEAGQKMIKGLKEAITINSLMIENKMLVAELRQADDMALNQALTIKKLQEENETLRRDVKTAVMGDSAELADVKRENKRLREALKPFASIETLFCDSDEMEFELWFLVKADGTNDNPKIKIGDLRAAAAAIRETDAH